MSFDIEEFADVVSKTNRYERRIGVLQENRRFTENIERTVSRAANNVVQERARSFVIYGEPQSGKTEMMIALTAKLLDEGIRIVVVLLNDNLQLLSQNLDRFKRSGLDPSPRNFSEVLDPSVSLKTGEWVIFCKKNARDLGHLLEKLDRIDGVAVIDDEADFATPNAKINKQSKTKINELVEGILKDSGVYIGVTATPARLDLNNTFNNQKERWVIFEPHPKYNGQKTFFPLESKAFKDLGFRLNLLPDAGDDPKYLRNALFRFLVNAAYLNKEINEKEENYSILVHTSGKKADHTEDYKIIIDTLAVLKDPAHKRYEKYVFDIWSQASAQYPALSNDLTRYILRNINRNTVVVMNSDIDKKVIDFNSATNPSALFTIAIGGNIVSRGVTFENLLSMYFTRDVKHKIQQDTYIQRARMFGTRGHYLSHFELSIPESLYEDWHKCFIFHRLALESIEAGNGSPVWLADKRISVAASTSIDKATVSMDKGEMSFELFEFSKSDIDDILNSDLGAFEKLEKLSGYLGGKSLPPYLLEYIRRFGGERNGVLAIHPSRDMSGYSDADQEKIERKKGFIGKSDLELDKYPSAVHHIKILFNQHGKARVFYKYFGGIKFIKNLK